MVIYVEIFTRTDGVMKKWSKNPVVNILIGGVVVVALQGIIGNQADAAFVVVVHWILHSVDANAIPWIIVLCLLLLICGLQFYWLQHGKIVSLALKRANRLGDLDNSLLRNMASWISSANRTGGEKLILKDVLRDVRIAFEGHIHRAAILVPDATGEYLQCWSADEMPQESLDDMEFYIGSDPKKRETEAGVASLAFLNSRMHVGHMIQVSNQWVCEDFPNYYKKPQRNHPYLRYKSFVCVPIIGTDIHTRSATACLGIMCFDSQEDTIFDSEEIKTILFSVSSRIASAIILFKNVP